MIPNCQEESIVAHSARAHPTISHTVWEDKPVYKVSHYTLRYAGLCADYFAPAVMISNHSIRIIGSRENTSLATPGAITDITQTGKSKMATMGSIMIDKV